MYKITKHHQATSDQVITTYNSDFNRLIPDNCCKASGNVGFM